MPVQKSARRTLEKFEVRMCLIENLPPCYFNVGRKLQTQCLPWKLSLDWKSIFQNPKIHIHDISTSVSSPKVQIKDLPNHFEKYILHESAVVFVCVFVFVFVLLMVVCRASPNQSFSSHTHPVHFSLFLLVVLYLYLYLYFYLYFSFRGSAAILDIAGI